MSNDAEVTPTMRPVTTYFPDWDKGKLLYVAHREAKNIARSHGQWPEPAHNGEVVNLLRHDFSDYDAEPTAERHRAVCEAIAEAYPWLAQACEAQIRGRRKRDEAIAAWRAAQPHQGATS